MKFNLRHYQNLLYTKDRLISYNEDYVPMYNATCRKLWKDSLYDYIQIPGYLCTIHIKYRNKLSLLERRYQQLSTESDRLWKLFEQKVQEKLKHHNGVVLYSDIEGYGASIAIYDSSLDCIIVRHGASNLLDNFNNLYYATSKDEISKIYSRQSQIIKRKGVYEVSLDFFLKEKIDEYSNFSLSHKELGTDKHYLKYMDSVFVLRSDLGDEYIYTISPNSFGRLEIKRLSWPKCNKIFKLEFK